MAYSFPAHEGPPSDDSQTDLPSPARRASLGKQVALRVRKWWVIKMLSTFFGMVLFFIGYVALLRHPLFPVTIMPLTFFDGLIRFRSEALPVYLSLWFYVLGAPALIADRTELRSYAVISILLSLIGLGIFLVWPTAVPAPKDTWTDDAVFAFLKSVDDSGNACPSLHVAFAVFTAAWFDRLLRQMGTGRLLQNCNFLWCAAIAYSTLALRQHVMLDVVAGAALGAGAAAVNFFWLQWKQA
ncbi:MAG: phosphatase PAP2 family protein [Bdellovibrionota bacterium]